MGELQKSKFIDSLLDNALRIDPDGTA